MCHDSDMDFWADSESSDNESNVCSDIDSEKVVSMHPVYLAPKATATIAKHRGEGGGVTHQGGGLD